MSLVNSPEFARKLGIESNTLEGYLMPDTYNFIWGDEEENITSRLVEEFKKFYNDTFENKSERTWIHNSPSYYSCINYRRRSKCTRMKNRGLLAYI
jgi:cell division protein YceG involved in septum cleavage